MICWNCNSKNLVNFLFTSSYVCSNCSSITVCEFMSKIPESYCIDLLINYITYRVQYFIQNKTLSLMIRGNFKIISELNEVDNISYNKMVEFANKSLNLQILK